MTTVEEDAARVQAVTELLAGPQKVWVLVVDNKHGATCSVYASEALAREAWMGALKANYATYPEYDTNVDLIANGCTMIECPLDTFWTLRECEVATK